MANLVLIGMPGSGKSTVGVLLAKYLSMDFVDTDILIQKKHGLSLQEIIEESGYLALREAEEKVILDLELGETVIATGGSAVYSARAMRHLKNGGRVFYLDLDVGELLGRITDFDTRGIARAPGQGFDDLYRERKELYLLFSDEVVDCRGMGHEEVAREIIRRFPGTDPPSPQG